jgi:hypothetical protein
VVKNNSQNSFTHRVIPNDHVSSWLYERVTTDDEVLGRMPLYDNPLTEGQLKAIREWINAGAPDVLGQPYAEKNVRPRWLGTAAFIDTFGIQFRVDTLRDANNFYSPFGTMRFQRLHLFFDIQDDQTPVGDLQNVTLMLSKSFFNLDSAITLPLVYSQTPRVVDNFYGPGKPGRFHWSVSFIPATYFGRQEFGFMRIRAQDTPSNGITEFPSGLSNPNLHYYHAFYVFN